MNVCVWYGCVRVRVSCLIVSSVAANKVIYGNSRTFLGLKDPARVHPVTKVREGRPPPAPRLKQTMRDLANEYERLLQERPGAASDHYAANGQGTPTPLLDLPYDWTAAPMACTWYTLHACAVSVCAEMKCLVPPINLIIIGQKFRRQYHPPHQRR